MDILKDLFGISNIMADRMFIFTIINALFIMALLIILMYIIYIKRNKNTINFKLSYIIILLLLVLTSIIYISYCNKYITIMKNEDKIEYVINGFHICINKKSLNPSTCYYYDACVYQKQPCSCFEAQFDNNEQICDYILEYANYKNKSYLRVHNRDYNYGDIYVIEGNNVKIIEDDRQLINHNIIWINIYDILENKGFKNKLNKEQISIFEQKKNRVDYYKALRN